MALRTELFGVFAFFGLVAVTTGFFFDSKVCYPLVGCFSRTNPFNNTIGALPDSPHKINIRTFLWTKDNPNNSQELKYTDISSISNSHFDSARPTKILLHGFMSSKDDSPAVANLSAAFLEKFDYNIIGVDWSAGAKQFYPKAVANTRVVGATIANLVNTLKDKFGLKLRDLHVIGHSLGAHAAGYVGRRVPGVARVTGLDPAGPMFTGTHPDVRLDPTDAIFVDAIHSDAGPLSDAGFGTMQPMADADFYPNGGTYQPGCPPPVKTTLEEIVTLRFAAAFDSVSCSHDRAIWYFIESVKVNNCHFPAVPCTSWGQFKGGHCSCQTPPCPEMGISSISSKPNGTFYLATLPKMPFCSMYYIHNF